MDELRIAVRRSLKQSAATLVSIAALGCAIGAAAVTWSVVSAVLLYPLPLENPDRLMVIRGWPANAAGVLTDGFIYPYYPGLRTSGVFEGVAAEWSVPLTLLVDAGAGRTPTSVGFVSRDYFDVLGVAVPIGRSFSTEEDRRGAAPVAILTDRYWQRSLARDAGAIGRAITVAGKSVTIVGIAAHGFRGLNLAQAPDLYLPLEAIADIGSPLTNYFADANHPSSPAAGLKIVGRIAPGTPIAPIAGRLSALAVVPGGPMQYALTPVNEAAIPEAARNGMRQFTRLLAGTVGLLLLIGCGTVGMLLLVRTEARVGEFAVCLALGASRTRLVRGVAIEGGLLTAAGAALSLPIAWWLFAAVRAFQLPGGVSIELLDLRLDGRTLAATIGAAMAVAAIVTLIAGAFGFAAQPASALRSRAGATPRLTRRRTRAALVMGQVAVALVLLAGAGLLARSLEAALSLNVGVEMDRVVTGSLLLGQYGYAVPRATAFFDDLRVRLAGNAAIRSFSYDSPQGGMGPSGKLTIDGEPRRFATMVAFRAVDAQYFDTLRIPVIAGRGLSRDDGPTAPLVTVVSESFGRLVANGASPLHHRITMPFRRPNQPAPVVEIVGVVRDVVTNVSVLQPLVMYSPLSQAAPDTSRSFTMRAALDANAVRREALGAINQLDPGVTPQAMLTLEETIGRQMSAQRFGALVLGALSTIAVLLTVLGTYVLAESMAVLRMREMGIRAALGATGRQLGAIVLAETGRLVGLGLATGFLLASLGASTIRGFLFQITPFDPATLVSVAAAILVLAAIVSLRPAWRAARVDLAQVLRDE